MRLVLDTNVLLVSLSPDSAYSPIFDALLNGEFVLLLSNEIISEYEEIVGRRYDYETVQNLLRFLVSLQNAELVVPHYHWKLIINDPDDDKLVDLAVAGNVDYIITNDRHFKILESTAFPIVKTMKAEEFLKMLAAS